MPSWDDPATVAFFRDRPPDHRLVALLEAGVLPCGARVLDLGCAAGRNADYLTALEVDVLAVDASAAMIAATRGRELARVAGTEHTYVGWGGHENAAPMVLHEPDALDAAFLGHGLTPAEPTVRVERRTGPDDRGAASAPHPAWGTRVTVNARYRRAAP